ncbi:MAG TPA: trypsin-like peptidase domain-containing protein [Vicinamibacteria bacterium]|nr:trypsin-like peptidase domain-containing protein [Vicinamibacteria bacterium]
MTTLTSLNDDLMKLAEKAGASVVRVQARRGPPSSGIAWSAEGLVVTAEHTLERDEDLGITTSSGETYEAEIAGRDPSTGVALLRAKKARLTVPSWREPGDVSSSELAVVVTPSPAGARAALTTMSGAASEGESEPGGLLGRALEIDARPFRGFSGSLLVDARGLGIGMVTAGFRRRAALVIPVETLRRVAGSLLEHGEVRRGFLGIATYPVRLPRRIESQRVGLLVLSVQEGSPAEQGGLFLGDVILEVAGQRIESPAQLLSLLTEERAGKNLEMRLLRTGSEQTITVTAGVRS